MLKPRVISDEERARAAEIAAAPVVSECRPGIRGRCGIQGCPRCDPPQEDRESEDA